MKIRIDLTILLRKMVDEVLPDSGYHLGLGIALSGFPAKVRLHQPVDSLTEDSLKRRVT